MVRCLVSTMVAAGHGALPESVVRERLESGDRHQLPQAAPAGGLALTAVGYPDDPNRLTLVRRR
jgi:tRNA U38,U39,U40 pseudouridine synthase TruA